MDNQLFQSLIGGSSIIQRMTDNFAKRNIAVLWFKSFDEIRAHLLTQIPSAATVGIGNSATLKRMGIIKALHDRGNTVFDKNLAATPGDVRELKRASLLADCYISGSNAVSECGRIVNIDHSGNRVAAISYGPDKVYIVVGRNKITATYDRAVKRARDTAAPLNAKRAGYNPPCAAAGFCVDCNSPERVCFVVSTIEGQHVQDRLTLLIADEVDGF